MTAPEGLLPVTGPTAPPRANGELVFAAPWESRVFGLTLALHERGVFPWAVFQARLIDAIGAWEAAHANEQAEYPYYLCWQQALEALLADLGLCPPEALDDRIRALVVRPHGHDH